MHRKSAADPSAGQHDNGLDVASDTSTAYLRWIADLLMPHLGASTLEVGSGHGAVTQYIAVGRRFVATDVSVACLDALHARFDAWPDVEVRPMDLRAIDIDETFDSAVMVNVLEHIYDDAEALRALASRLKPGGRCLIYVPALNWLYGPYDRDVGHYRRYSKRRLAAVARDAGLRPLALRYVNVLAIPAWMLLSLTWRGGGDMPRVGRGLDLWDRVGVPLTRALERTLPPPIGLNLFCVACKD